MPRSAIIKKNYPIQIAVWVSEDMYDKIKTIAKDKGYGSHWDKVLNVKLKQPKTGAARLIREIVEEYIEKINLPKQKT